MRSFRHVLFAAWLTPLALPTTSYGAVSVGQAVEQHWIWSVGAAVVILTMLGFLLHFVHVSRKLARLRAQLMTELAQRQTIETSVERDRNLLRVLIDNIPDGIFIKDVNGKYINCNLAHAQFCGLETPQQVIGKSVYDFHPAEVAKTYEGYDRLVVESGKPQSAREGYISDAKGRKQWAMVSKIPVFDAKGALSGLVGITRDISIRKEKEELLRASEARIRLIIETASDAFISMDSQGLITEWNPEAELTFGWKRDEAIGRSVVQTIVPPRFRDRFEQGLRSFNVTGTGEVLGQRLELTALHRDHHEFPVEVTVAPARVGDATVFFSFVHDISARKRAEEERDRFFTLSSDLVSVSGFDGLYKRVNPAFEAVLGFSPTELLARPWIEWVHPDDVAATTAEAEKIARGNLSTSFENRFRCKDGSYRWLAWTSVPVVKERLIYAIAHDMTRRKKNEELLAEKNRQLEETARSEREASQKLKEAQGHLVQSEKLAALGQLVAGVAHEINNPLSFVSNNVAVLQRDLKALINLVNFYREADPLIEAQKPDLIVSIRELCEQLDIEYTLANLGDMMVRSRDGLKRIQQIVKDLRDFARLDQSDHQEVDLNVGVESTVNIIRGRAKSKQVTVDLELGALPLVSCFPAKINQVVMNLVANAIDACSQGGNVIVKTRKIEDPQRGPAVQIDVQDTGSGIEPAVREKIFDPFFTTKPQGEGTGLGLSISYGIIRDHNGTISVDSTPGKGSCFTIHLPIHSAVKTNPPIPQAG